MEADREDGGRQKGWRQDGKIEAGWENKGRPGGWR
jgi:hypothetical protein